MHTSTTSPTTAMATHAYGDILRHWSGHQLSAAANLDDEFASYLSIQGDVQLCGAPGGYIAFCDDSVSADETVLRYIIACRPAFASGSTMPDRELCESAARDLLAQARDMLGFTEDELDAEFAIFAAAFMSEHTDFSVVAALWQIVACRTDVVMTAELHAAISDELVSPYVAEAITQSLVAEGIDPDEYHDERTHRAMFYQELAAERSSQRIDGHPVFSDADLDPFGDEPPSREHLLLGSFRPNDGSPIIGCGTN